MFLRILIIIGLLVIMLIVILNYIRMLELINANTYMNRSITPTNTTNPHSLIMPNTNI